uniref:60S ribosomal protein L29 n=1 Tax=Rhabditophanes sp. KR3021 TaxID=114890 RepID=A0AC35U7H7_9BILA
MKANYGVCPPAKKKASKKNEKKVSAALSTSNEPHDKNKAIKKGPLPIMKYFEGHHNITKHGKRDFKSKRFFDKIQKRPDGATFLCNGFVMNPKRGRPRLFRQQQFDRTVSSASTNSL